MIPLLADDVDLVVASPYHPEGRVRNIPGWRLFLSRTASAGYRLLSRQSLHTYTSCFRVYRRSVVAGLPLRSARFEGMAEIVGRLDLAGSRIAEYPAVLEARRFGRSKMRLFRTMLGHLRLFSELAWLRWTGRG
jgi:dolichol-phosphate mannosyltransferase